jgi:DNA polymerase-3 subunit alpha
MKFPCGCEFTKDKPFDPYHPPDCPEAWNLIKDGKTKGMFQIESYLCKHWSKQLKPDNIELLSALIALVRPGVLKAKDQDGKSMAQLFVDRRHGAEYEPLDINIKDELNDSYSVMLYQEQTIQIAKKLAGFDLKQADTLRKGVGKKDPAIISKLRIEFIDGCIKTGLINHDKAEYIFDIIEKSNRYQFNKSHSVSYSLTSYLTAYIKSHFTDKFFKIWLKHARDDMDHQQEIRELVNDAKLFEIQIKSPRLLDLERDVYTRGKTIHFGLADIKGIGEKQVEKLKSTIQGNSFQDFCRTIPQKVLTNLIKAGALDEFGQRNKLLFELGLYHQFSAQEQQRLHELGIWLDQLDQYNDRLKSKGGICATNKRREVVDSISASFQRPPKSLRDTPRVIAEFEKDMFGISLSASKVVSREASETCLEFLKEQVDKGLFAVEINHVTVRKIKTGPNKGLEMCSMIVSDITGQIDNVVCFSSEYEQYYSILISGNTILLEGERSKDRRQLILRKAYQST